MKKLFFLFAVIVAISCNNAKTEKKVEAVNNLEIKNGKDENVKVTCMLLKDLEKKLIYSEMLSRI